VTDVRFWPLADIQYVAFDVAFGGKADMGWCTAECLLIPKADILSVHVDLVSCFGPETSPAYSMTSLRARLPSYESQPCPKRKLPKRNPFPSPQRRSRIMSLRYRSSRAPAGRWRIITRGTTQGPHQEQAVSAHGGLHLRTSRRKISSSVHVAGRRVRASITLIRDT
jgi:hypothetical protein